MYIDDYTQWKSVLFVTPIYTDSDNVRLNKFRELLLKANHKMVINAVRWNNDKQAAKSKSHVRVVNEWNHADFNWLGKNRNRGIEDYFKRPYAAMILFTDEMPIAALKIVQNAHAKLKIGFSEDLDNFEVILKSENEGLEVKLGLVERYFLGGR
jgi:hypothetical protein